MKTDFYLSSSLKIAVIIFIPLAILLSLFPPYYWGNEKIRTLSERIRSDIDDQLPIKSYDLLFGSNKKLFKLGSYTLTNKYYENEFNSLDKILSDAIESEFYRGIDTFTTTLSITHKMDAREEAENEKKKQNTEKSTLVRRNIGGSGQQSPKIEKQQPRKYDLSGFAQRLSEEREKKVAMQVKRVDSIKSFRVYTIKKPNYYLLGREIILSELFINYLLAFFLSIGLGLIIVKVKQHKRE